MYATAAEKTAAYRARRGGTRIELTLSSDTVFALDAYIERQWAIDPVANRTLTRSDVIDRLIQRQLIRKR